MSRSVALDRFYRALDTLEVALGGKRVLGQCTGRMNWAKRGVYFFFEQGVRELGTDDMRAPALDQQRVDSET